MPVSALEFGRLPRLPGWTYERTDGRLCREPDWRYRAARWTAPLPDVSDLEGVVLEAATESDLDALETVRVRPRGRRQGIAAAMLKTVLEAADVEVRSNWLVANRESGAWHRSVGLEVVPISVSMPSESTAERWANGETSGSLLGIRDHVLAQRRPEDKGLSPDPFAFAQPVHRRAAAVR